MSQSNFIVGAIFVVFIVYITLKGELPAYMRTLGIGGGGNGASPIGAGGSGASVLGTFASVSSAIGL